MNVAAFVPLFLELLVLFAMLYMLIKGRNTRPSRQPRNRVRKATNKASGWLERPKSWSFNLWNRVHSVISWITAEKIDADAKLPGPQPKLTKKRDLKHKKSVGAEKGNPQVSSSGFSCVVHNAVLILNTNEQTLPAKEVELKPTKQCQDTAPSAARYAESKPDVICTTPDNRLDVLTLVETRCTEQVAPVENGKPNPTISASSDRSDFMEIFLEINALDLATLGTGTNNTGKWVKYVEKIFQMAKAKMVRSAKSLDLYGDFVSPTDGYEFFEITLFREASIECVGETVPQTAISTLSSRSFPEFYFDINEPEAVMNDAVNWVKHVEKLFAMAKATKLAKSLDSYIKSGFPNCSYSLFEISLFDETANQCAIKTGEDDSNEQDSPTVNVPPYPALSTSSPHSEISDISEKSAEPNESSSSENYEEEGPIEPFFRRESTSSSASSPHAPARLNTIEPSSNESLNSFVAPEDLVSTDDEPKQVPEPKLVVSANSEHAPSPVHGAQGTAQPFSGEDKIEVDIDPEEQVEREASIVVKAAISSNGTFEQCCPVKGQRRPRAMSEPVKSTSDNSSIVSQDQSSMACPDEDEASANIEPHFGMALDDVSVPEDLLRLGEKEASAKLVNPESDQAPAIRNAQSLMARNDENVKPASVPVVEGELKQRIIVPQSWVIHVPAPTDPATSPHLGLHGIVHPLRGMAHVDATWLKTFGVPHGVGPMESTPIEPGHRRPAFLPKTSYVAPDPVDEVPYVAKKKDVSDIFKIVTPEMLFSDPSIFVIPEIGSPLDPELDDVFLPDDGIKFYFPPC